MEVGYSPLYILLILGTSISTKKIRKWQILWILSMYMYMHSYCYWRQGSFKYVSELMCKFVCKFVNV